MGLIYTCASNCLAQTGPGFSQCNPHSTKNKPKLQDVEKGADGAGEHCTEQAEYPGITSGG